MKEFSSMALQRPVKIMHIKRACYCRPLYNTHFRPYRGTELYPGSFHLLFHKYSPAVSLPFAVCKLKSSC